VGPAAKFWASFLVAQVLYLVIMLWSLPRVTEAAGDLPPFDMLPRGYGLDEARAFLMALSSEGRAHYLKVQLPLDMAYPAALAVMFALGFRLLYRGRVRTILLVLALGVMAFDYLENVWIARMLLGGVDGLDAGTVSVASLWTVLKSICTTLAYLALLFGAARALWRRMAGAAP